MDNHFGPWTTTAAGVTAAATTIKGRCFGRSYQ